MPPNLTLAELHIRVPKSLIEFIKAKKRQRRTRRADGRAATGRTVTCAIASCHMTGWHVMKARAFRRPRNFRFSCRSRVCSLRISNAAATAEPAADEAGGAGGIGGQTDW